MATAAYLVSLDVTQPTLRTPTGSFYLVANPGDAPGPLTLEIPGRSPSFVTMTPPAAGGGNNYAYLYTGLPTDVYLVGVHDAGPSPVAAFSVTIDVGSPPQATLGCTDPQALNPTAGATADDGSCQYTAPTVLPFFNVPLLQSLRFALRGGPVQGFDNLLFCEQPRPGQQKRPYYYQLVQSDDVVRVQVLTTYTNVTASIYHHGGSQVGAAVPLTLALHLQGQAAPLAVTLSENVATGTTRLAAAAGGALPPSLLAAARLRLAGALGGTYRITQATQGTLLVLDDYVVLNRPWAPVAGAVTATWQLLGPGFDVYEAELPISTLAAGYYEVKLRATQAGWPSQLAESEPIHVKAVHATTVAVDYRANDNCFGLVFTTGYTPRVRVLATLFRQKNGGTESSYTDSAARLTILSSTATRLVPFETYGQPAWVHEKLFLALRLDYLLLDGVPYVTPAAYETSDVRAYPLSAGRADLQQKDFLGEGNGHDVGVDDSPVAGGFRLADGGYLLLRGRG
jgi:hypothetical protein